jgi:hypothetical protein
MNIIQDTPRNSCLDYTANNITTNLNNIYEKENSANKNHVNANIKKPVRRTSIGIINNLNSLGLLFRGMKNKNENFSSTFAAINNNNFINHNEGSVIINDTKPFFLNETKSNEEDRIEKTGSTHALTSLNSNQFMTSSFINNNKDKYNNMAPKGLQLLKESIIGQLGLSNQVDINNEVRKIRKELELYKTTVTNLSDELLYLKSHNLNSDKIISDFQVSQKKILECEIENFNHTLKIYKSLYDEEIRSKRKVIEDLARIVDEVYVK